MTEFSEFRKIIVSLDFEPFLPKSGPEYVSLFLRNFINSWFFRGGDYFEKKRKKFQFFHKMNNCELQSWMSAARDLTFHR